MRGWEAPRLSSGKTSRQTASLTISRPAADAHPADLQDWIRQEWLIEALHHIRDVTFREDAHQAWTSNGRRLKPFLSLFGFGMAIIAIYHRLRGR
jgi:predicted transposase YbfD/YdcC